MDPSRWDLMDPPRSNNWFTSLPKQPGSAETDLRLGKQSDPNGPDQTVRLRMHSTQEWEAVYPIIKQLYVTERKKLSKLMAIMERKHGFKATEQMYKKRFTAWGLSKNMRRRADPSSDKTREARVTSGASQLAVPSRTADRFQDSANVVCMSLTGQYYGEGALSGIADWTKGNLDGKQWLWTGTPVTYPSSRMQRDFAFSYALLSRGKGDLAGMAVRKAFWQLEDVLKDGDAGMMRNLVDIFVQMMQRKQTVLIRMLILQLASLATRDLSTGHPLTRVFHDLARNQDDFENLLQQTWRCFVDNLHRGMDRNHQWLYENWAWDSSLHNVDTDPDEDYRIMTESLEALTVRTDEVHTQGTSRSHFDVAKSMMLVENGSFLPTASINNLKAMKDEDTTPAMGPENGMEGYAATYLKTAIIKRAMDREDWSSAEELMRSNVRKMAAAYGEASGEVIRELWSLEKVLKRAGQMAKAELVAKAAMERVHRYLADVPNYV